MALKLKSSSKRRIRYPYSIANYELAEDVDPVYWNWKKHLQTIKVSTPCHCFDFQLGRTNETRAFSLKMNVDEAIQLFAQWLTSAPVELWEVTSCTW
jgi:hypothetical protein